MSYPLPVYLYMMQKIIWWCLNRSYIKLLSVRSQSIHFTTMNSVLQIINTALTFETMTFLRDLVMMAIVSPDYEAVLNRIMVRSLTIFKDPQPPCHEGIRTLTRIPSSYSWTSLLTAGSSLQSLLFCCWSSFIQTGSLQFLSKCSQAKKISL